MNIDNKLSRQLIPLLVPLLILFSGCQSTPPPLNSTPTIEVLTVTSVQVDPGDYIAFSGESSLPDDTCLQGMLYQDERPLPWWPGDCIRVSNGRWQLRVSLGVDGTPTDLSQETQYNFLIWQQQDPGIKADPFWFDLAGPPQP